MGISELDLDHDGIATEWSLFYNAPIPISIVSLKGEFTDVNSAWAEALGYSVEDLKKMNYADITAIDDLEGDLDQVKKISETNGQQYARFIKKYIRRDGTEIEFELYFNTINDQDGNVKGFVSWMLPTQLPTVSVLSTIKKWQVITIILLLIIDILQFIFF